MGSTALRILAGLEEPTAGDLLIDGRNVRDVPPKDRDIAMVFQSYALYPHLSVRENIAFGLKLHHLPNDEIERRVAEASELLGLDEMLGKLLQVGRPKGSTTHQSTRSSPPSSAHH